MAVPKTTIWDLEPHTAAKHDILRQYLSAWFPILNTYNTKILYIDGFSGPGRYKGGEIGSPLIALEVARTHRQKLEGEIHFWFIDEDEDRLAYLVDQLAAIDRPPHFIIHTDHGRFHEVIGAALDGIAPDHGIIPTFAFIDPFGFKGIPFSMVRRLLQQDKCEVLVTFMVDSVNRWINAPNEAIRRQIAEAFGSDEPLSIMDGLGERIGKLRSLYQKKLSEHAKYVRYFEMSNANDRPIYYLFFATNNPLGHVKMKTAMWKVNSDGQYRFSDGTDQNQMVFLRDDPASQLGAALMRQFAGKGELPVVLATRYVEDETAYLRTHMLAAMRSLEGNGKLAVNPKKQDGRNRKKGTFPDDALIRIVS
ncbi:MAG: three-Cys-motif partner protein TcmP [Candidatus Coatesbacteria bacterium]